MKRIFLFFLILLLSSVASQSYAQDTLVLSENGRWDTILDMRMYTGLYEDRSGKLAVEDVSKKAFFVDTNYGIHLNKFKGENFNLWNRWIIQNPLPDEQRVKLAFHKSSFVKLFFKIGDSIIELKNTYQFFSFQKEIDRRSIVIEIPHGQSVTLWAKFEHPYFNYEEGYPLMMREDEYIPLLRNTSYDNRYIIFFDVFFLSVVLFILLHSLALFFFNNKRQEYLYYAFYAFCVFNYFLFKFDELFYVDMIYSYFPLIVKNANNPLSYLMFYSYYRFVRTFIDFKELAPWFFKAIIITERILLGAIVVDVILNNIYAPGFRFGLFNIIRIGLIIMAFIGIYLLFRSRKILSYFIAVGSGLLIIGSLIAMILSWYITSVYPGEMDPIMAMQAGILFELICFTLGLSYKTSLSEKEKIETQQLLINKLEENKKLQEELTEKLELRVKEQTTHIISQQKELEKEKEQQLTLEFQKKLTEMELQLLKSQLNPHFYFNTLNNLYGLSMISPVKAPDAILKLSDIMEYVIYDCKSEKVPLLKELKFIHSYVELEKLRYDQDDLIKLDIDAPDSGLEISPLLLIQFIENAFKHGLEDHSSGAFLKIKIRLRDGILYYNSVNSISGKEHEKGGVGLENVKKRLEILYPQKYDLVIIQSDTTYEVDLHLDL